MEVMVMPPCGVDLDLATGEDDDAVADDDVDVEEDDLSRSSFWDGKLDAEAIVEGAVGDDEATVATGGVTAAIRVILSSCWDLVIARGAAARNAFDDELVVASSTAADSVKARATDRWNIMVFYAWQWSSYIDLTEGKCTDNDADAIFAHIMSNEHDADRCWWRLRWHHKIWLEEK